MPVALIAQHNVVSSPRSWLVVAPTCFLPLLLTTFPGFWIIYIYIVRISAGLAERLSVLAFRLGYYYILMTGNLFVKESSSIISQHTLHKCLNLLLVS